jgi:hypothetical protein
LFYLFWLCENWRWWWWWWLGGEELSYLWLKWLLDRNISVDDLGFGRIEDSNHYEC